MFLKYYVRKKKKLYPCQILSKTINYNYIPTYLILHYYCHKAVVTLILLIKINKIRKCTIFAFSSQRKLDPVTFMSSTY